MLSQGDHSPTSEPRPGQLRVQGWLRHSPHGVKIQGPLCIEQKCCPTSQLESSSRFSMVSVRDWIGSPKFAC